MTATAADTPTPTRSSGFRAAQRQLADALAGARESGDADPSSLESRRLAPADPPRLVDADTIEGRSVAARPVPAIETGFAGFLDGIQVSRIVRHMDAIPVVHGAIGAVIRERSERRLNTWRHEIEERLYAPRAFLSASALDAIDSLRTAVVDTTPLAKDGSADADGRHPLGLGEAALKRVQGHRESLEERLAERWIIERRDPLYMDGGISGSARVAASDAVVGVVKSHRTLYGNAGAVQTVLQLRAGERSTAFAVSPRSRAPVASWYLRLREGSDPLWGLVRIEVRLPAENERASLTMRADQISGWVLAEATPLSLPDGRWDTMAYGIRDCEQFLKAIIR